MMVRQGIRAAIVGRPNVGKSSLLNAMLRGERAIVTPVPGTTRDTLEETVNIQGLPLVLVDTAGIREDTEGEVERLGVARSRAALERADLALLVVDGSQDLTAADADIAALLGNKPCLVAVNKNDLPQLGLPPNFLPDAPRISLSALTGEGVPEMENAIVDLVFKGEVVSSDLPMVSNPRHKALLQRAHEHILTALQAQQERASEDLISIDVREAIDQLGEITGETAGPDLLEAIFSRFCIGK
jgi:tRNA modification GTPase